jgi:hypothetical protein
MRPRRSGESCRRRRARRRSPGGAPLSSEKKIYLLVGPGLPSLQTRENRPPCALYSRSTALRIHRTAQARGFVRHRGLPSTGEARSPTAGIADGRPVKVLAGFMQRTGSPAREPVRFFSSDAANADPERDAGWDHQWMLSCMNARDRSKALQKSPERSLPERTRRAATAFELVVSIQPRRPSRHADGRGSVNRIDGSRRQKAVRCTHLASCGSAALRGETG